MGLVKKTNEISFKNQVEHRQTKRELTGLLEQLRHDDPRTRRWAAHDLVEYASEAVKPLCERLQEEMDLAVREAILSTLLKIGNQEAVEHLVEFLRSEDTALRCSVVEVLQKFTMPVMDYLEKILEDPNKDVRIFAINILRDLVHPKAPIWLLNVIQNDDDVNVAGAAVDCLAEIGKPYIVPELFLLKERFSDEPYLEFAVDTAIRRIEGK